LWGQKRSLESGVFQPKAKKRKKGKKTLDGKKKKKKQGKRKRTSKAVESTPALDEPSKKKQKKNKDVDLLRKKKKSKKKKTKTKKKKVEKKKAKKTNVKKKKKKTKVKKKTKKSGGKLLKIKKETKRDAIIVNPELISGKDATCNTTLSPNHMYHINKNTDKEKINQNSPSRKKLKARKSNRDDISPSFSSQSSKLKKLSSRTKKEFIGGNSPNPYEIEDQDEFCGATSTVDITIHEDTTSPYTTDS